MKKSEAVSFGRAKILKATGILTSVILLVFMLTQTVGDFANGLLFFFEALFNIHVLVILAILFSLTYVLGGIAGTEIIIGKKDFLLVSVKYAVSIVLVVYIYIALVGIVKEGLATRQIYSILKDYFITPFIKSGLLVTIIMLLIWAWATNEMKKAADRVSE